MTGLQRHGLTDGMAAVVFDFFGTLTPVSPPELWADNAARLAQVLGVPAATLVQALDDSFPERISGALGDVRETLRNLAGRRCAAGRRAAGGGCPGAS